MLEYLPLLDGWESTGYEYPGVGTIVAKGQTVPVLSKDNAVGWVLGIDFAASDSQMEFCLETDRFNTIITPAELQALGAVLPPPDGSYINIYNQPNPASTYGTYIGSVLTTAFPYPWKGKIKAYATLSSLSTQQSALAQYSISVIEITDVDAFTKSYRSLHLQPSDIVNAIKQALKPDKTDEKMGKP